MLSVSLASSSTPLLDAAASHRALHAVVGSFVADAASMPLHWIYNTSKVAQLVATAGGDPAFFPTPSCPYYDYPFGEQSPYGQQSLLYLKALAQSIGGGKGWSDDVPSALESDYFASYRPGGLCKTACGACYQDGSTKGFVANELKGLRWPSCGANDTQANAIAHMPALVARFAGQGAALLDRVAALTRVTQNTDEAVAFALAAARILESAILYGSDGSDAEGGVAAPHLRARGAVRAAVQAMKDPHRAHPMPQDGRLAARIEALLTPTALARSNFDVVQEVGQACDYPYNLLSGAHLIAQGAPSYADAVGQRILAGGDSCSANMWNGAVFGALAADAGGLPSGWLAKLTHADAVASSAKLLLREATG
ncbi:hypothetical protein EMIHUDRAFT_218325 [Emiliania huxleyi CCMP1516]|uniref:ADP-ribosylglycohydrolase n=2 Tax=Emiliania huxleyi TaxID=2903 RepID=A0A0D3I927_EMIH1|nr:hypothetical protein EMIHUDRAFT_218325 [Emiliania huxleyi CCMP1516]EOD07762.1 hypothetical protein EMIHUDRAFT_218325 [Emiliania huxleyi CCMP1516]|eukprot:XP_005760191.1 hypothetical protein EMIHUDRAFT_218325 [Emiliania huxleyi CCMP1516]